MNVLLIPTQKLCFREVITNAGISTQTNYARIRIVNGIPSKKARFTSGRSVLDVPIKALPFLALTTPLCPTPADILLVIHSHVHKKIRLCRA